MGKKITKRSRQFCEFPEGTCKGPGKCVDKLVNGACAAVWTPVCGCDGKTYSNDCYRNMAGVSKKYDGECEGENECTDTDDGKDYYTIGTVRKGSDKGFDSCVDAQDNRCGSSDRIQEYYCENNNIMSIMVSCPFGCNQGQCETEVTSKECGGEGDLPASGRCCEGLTMKGAATVGENGECLYMRHVECLKCGDGICDSKYENKCNCPEDCKIECSKELNKEECELSGGEYEYEQCPIGYPCDPKGYCKCPCKTDSDCPDDMCQQGRCANAYCCYEYTYECVSGKCEYEKKEYKGYTRVGGKCVDTCGDGVCKFPEAQWWCPEDCKEVQPICTKEGIRIHIGDPACCDGLIRIGNDFVDSEGLCNGIDDGSGYCTKCGDGICKSPENKCNCPEDCKEEIKCSDTDGGKDYYKKGIVTGKRLSSAVSYNAITGEEKIDDPNNFIIDTLTDYCSNPEMYPSEERLVEYYCRDDGIIGNEFFECPNGCRDGACIKEIFSADLNCDGNVNLTDTAILLSFWNKDLAGATSCQSPDINQDGKINLADFSIMMSQWTK